MVPVKASDLFVFWGWGNDQPSFGTGWQGKKMAWKPASNVRQSMPSESGGESAMHLRP